MKKLLFIIIALLTVHTYVMGCTSAIIAASSAAGGRPLLWKHRDTGHELNFVEHVPARGNDLGYIALFNGGDSLLSEAWVGFNDAGFAVMNTASYNLAPDTASVKDREGLIMTMALKRCRSVADFERLLSELPKPLGVQANFGVIDALGNGAYFETDDHSFVKYDVKDAPDGILIRTNFSCSGKHGQGLGRVRYENARYLLDRHIADHTVTPDALLNDLSCSFYHSGMKRDMFAAGYSLVEDRGDFIPRYSTSGSIVIEGVVSPAQASECVMWVRPGYPPCSLVYKVTVDAVPEVLRPSAPGWNSPEWLRINKIKQAMFHKKGKRRYVNLDRLRMSRR